MAAATGCPTGPMRPVPPGLGICPGAQRSRPHPGRAGQALWCADTSTGHVWLWVAPSEADAASAEHTNGGPHTLRRDTDHARERKHAGGRGLPLHEGLTAPAVRLRGALEATAFTERIDLPVCPCHPTPGAPRSAGKDQQVLQLGVTRQGAQGHGTGPSDSTATARGPRLKLGSWLFWGKTTHVPSYFQKHYKGYSRIGQEMAHPTACLAPRPVRPRIRVLP